MSSFDAQSVQSETNSHKSQTSIQMNKNIVNNYNEFISYHPPYGNNSQYYLQDKILEIGYILTNPLIVINSKTYQPIGIVNISEPNPSIFKEGRIFSFLNKVNDLLIATYDTKVITVYKMNQFTPGTVISLANSITSNSLEQSKVYVSNLTKTLNESENIWKCQLIRNEQNESYFIVVTSFSQWYHIVYNYDMNQNIWNEHISKLDTSIKSNLFSSFLSSYFSSNNTENNIVLNNSDTLFILNPISYSAMRIGNNTLGNTLFIVSNKLFTQVKYEFSMNQVQPVIKQNNQTWLSKIRNKLPDKGASFYIEAADSCYSRINKSYHIYLVIRSSNLGIFLFNLSIPLDSPENVHIVSMNISQFYQDVMISKTYLIINKYCDEGFIVISENKVIYFNTKTKWSHNFKHFIVGINPNITPEGFSIDIFTGDKGIKNYKVKDQTFISKDRTYQFLSQYQYETSLAFIQNENNKNSFSQQNTNQATKQAEMREIISCITFIKQIQDKFMQSITDGKDTETPMSTDEEWKQEVLSYFNKNYDTTNILFESIKAMIINIVDDDSLNIEWINKRKKKAEFVIIDYLQYKNNQLQKLYHFLIRVGLFSWVDSGNQFNLLYFIYQTFEKLIIAINVREMENEYLEEVIETKKENSISTFLNIFYTKMNEIMAKNPKHANQPFTKQLLFGKISNISNTFVNVFFHSFFEVKHMVNIENKQFNDCKLLQYMVNVVNNIEKDLQLLIGNIWNNYERGQNVFINYRDALWNYNIDHIENNLFTLFQEVVLYKITDKNNNLQTDYVFLNAFHWLHCYQLYYSNNINSSEHKRQFYLKKIDVIGTWIQFDYRQSFDWAMKFHDYYNIAFISYTNKNELYETLKQFLKIQNNKKITVFVLKNILLWEAKCVNDKVGAFESFDFFDDFYDDYSQELEEICRNYIKLNSFFIMFKSARNKEYTPVPTNTEEIIHEKNTKNVDHGTLLHISKLEKIKNMFTKDGWSAPTQGYWNNSMILSNIHENNYIQSICFIAKFFNYAPLITECNNTSIFSNNLKMIEYLLGANIPPEVMSGYDKYRILMRLIQIGWTLGKYNQDVVRDLILELYKCAINHNYNDVVAILQAYKCEDMDNVPDNIRKYILDSSIVIPWVNEYHNTKEIYQEAVQFIQEGIKHNNEGDNPASMDLEGDSWGGKQEKDNYNSIKTKIQFLSFISK